MDFCPPSPLQKGVLHPARRQGRVGGLVDDCLAALGPAGPVPTVETAVLAVGRGICLALDRHWFISRGVVRDELERGLLISFLFGAWFISGAMRITRRASAAAPGIATFEEIARRIVCDLPGSVPREVG